MSDQPPASIGAIVLVGGRASRMGGGDKLLFDVGGATLFARAVHALQDAGCRPITAVGPELDAAAPVRWVREEPPYGGPVAALAAALADGHAGGSGHRGAAKTVPTAPHAGDERTFPSRTEVEPDWTVLLAGDLPRADDLVPRLVARIPENADGSVFVADGHPQWLAGIYRTSVLRGALADLGDGAAGVSCRALLGGLDLTPLPDVDGVTVDVDTPEDLARARERAARETITVNPRRAHD
ncbi:NTP transferase domain-containing protein [Microbacterium sp. KUDC0406]|uniref:molybdenum cofactor guanylyltransferase n=1 Tax=Microbacterium sp. KUDC0406 TaxID=2909588 RepID=UPI001F23A061|nr:NTP transferase domain-containing protein [Microbacterium sp. KUDC0406]UJP10141.1 NTP transferase domain-containing protein [Microbacterium sp. KUDC0406]